MKSSSLETLTVRNPYNDLVVTSDVQIAGNKEVNDAVAAAKAASISGPWSTFTGAQRSACMLKFADLVDQNQEDLARLETIAMGKPISLLLGFDIPHMIGCYRCIFFYVFLMLVY